LGLSVGVTGVDLASTTIRCHARIADIEAIDHYSQELEAFFVSTVETGLIAGIGLAFEGTVEDRTTGVRARSPATAGSSAIVFVDESTGFELGPAGASGAI
jgi:hypothetical protein